MTIRDYLKDRLIAYFNWAICHAITIIFLLAYKVGWQPIIVVTVISIMAVVSHEIWNLNRRKNFYNIIRKTTEELDQKYFLSEMLSEPEFYEGKFLCDTLYSCNKSMVENVNKYKKKASDFREYIELWVHEAKIPVASLRLISHNNPGVVSDKVNVQIKRIDDCIDNVLYYARSENAEKDYNIKEVSLKKVFSNVAVRNREALQLSGGNLTTYGLDREVMTDKKWLEFIVGQLMANSMKYASSKRPLEISVKAKEVDSNVILYFRDNGIGIVEADLPYVFEKSFTGHNGRSNSESTGMGLYIVKNLCDRLGHGISVSSKENEYTEFQITFAGNEFYKMS